MAVHERKNSNTAKDLDSFVGTLLERNVTFEESQHMYKNWALKIDGNTDFTYDEVCKNTEIYKDPNIIRNKLKELIRNPGESLVLDLGSGTGICAEMIVPDGFHSIIGLEPLKEFVELAQKKGLYKKILHEGVGNGACISSLDDTFDAVIASGVFAPGHIPSDALHEVVRVLKPGGYFINSMRREYLDTVPEYKDRLEPLCRQMEAEGKWQQVTWQTYPNHFMGHDGLLMVFQKC